MAKLMMKCEECEKIFYRPERFVKQSKHHFCGRECFHNHRLKHPNKFKHEYDRSSLNKLLTFANILEEDKKEK